MKCIFCALELYHRLQCTSSSQVQSKIWHGALIQERTVTTVLILHSSYSLHAAMTTRCAMGVAVLIPKHVWFWMQVCNVDQKSAGMKVHLETMRNSVLVFNFFLPFQKTSVPDWWTAKSCLVTSETHITVLCVFPFTVLSLTDFNNCHFKRGMIIRLPL